MVDQGYWDELEAWRDQREKNLTSPYGWLATAGLFWLEQGENRMGATPFASIRLPDGSGPALAGVFHLNGQNVEFTAAEGVELSLGDGPLVKGRIPIHDDTSEPIFLGELKLYVIQRGARLGVRVFDPHNPALVSFSGLSWYPIDPGFRLEGRLVPHVEPLSIQIVNVLGDVVEMVAPGYIEFVHNSQVLRLEPFQQEDGRLWIMFRDLTNRTETYPAGRYLIVEPPDHGRAILDFNKAYNPPCAYTAFATCPLPPPSNLLPSEICAGERRFQKIKENKNI